MVPFINLADGDIIYWSEDHQRGDFYSGHTVSLFIAICEMGIIMCDTTLPCKDGVKVKGIALINLGLCR